jgi:hypothetical protein
MTTTSIKYTFLSNEYLATTNYIDPYVLAAFISDDRAEPKHYTYLRFSKLVNS